MGPFQSTNSGTLETALARATHPYVRNEASGTLESTRSPSPRVFVSNTYQVLEVATLSGLCTFMLRRVPRALDPRERAGGVGHASHKHTTWLRGGASSPRQPPLSCPGLCTGSSSRHRCVSGPGPPAGQRGQPRRGGLGGSRLWQGSPLLSVAAHRKRRSSLGRGGCLLGFGCCYITSFSKLCFTMPQ